MDKYSYQLLEKQNKNIKNIEATLKQKSSRFGGSVLGHKCMLMNGVCSVIPNKDKSGGYYILKNVLKTKIGNEPEFLDIWLLTESIEDKETSLRIKSLQDLCNLNITYWKKDMLYPFTQKFLCWEDIKQHLTGYVRIIEFRCFIAGLDGRADPTMENSKQYNWVMNITEGKIKNGMKDGYCRTVSAFNGYG